MSKQSRFMPRRAIADQRHSDRDSIDWAKYEQIASQERADGSILAFTDEAKAQILGALDLLARNNTEVVKIRHLKDICKELQITLAPYTDEFIDQNLDDLIDALHRDAFFQAMANTADLRSQGKTILERLTEYQRLLRFAPDQVSLYLPSAEAMALSEVREAFQSSGMEVSITHTRPTSVPEGSECLSAFEHFVFEYVLGETGSDPAGRKVLQRRLDEAVRTVEEVRRKSLTT